MLFTSLRRALHGISLFVMATCIYVLFILNFSTLCWQISDIRRKSRQKQQTDNALIRLQVRLLDDLWQGCASVEAGIF